MVYEEQARRRYDPNDYARNKQLKLERARKLRSKRLNGTTDLDEECTFAPKINTKYRAPNHSRRQDNNNVYYDEESGVDALEQLSTQKPIRTRPQAAETIYDDDDVIPPVNDVLSTEVKRRIGKDLTPRAPAPAQKPKGCLRNSSCTCNLCDTSGGVKVPSQFANIERPSSRRTNREDLHAARSSSASSGMGLLETDPLDGSGSPDKARLSLLKSKMKSKRKTRSAPSTVKNLIPQEPESTVTHSPRKVRQQEATQRVKSRPQRVEQPHDSEVNGSTFPGVNVENEIDDDNATSECKTCGRTFNSTSFARHTKVCEKVFVNQRKTFNMTKKRLEGTEAEKILKEKKQGRRRESSKSKDPAEQPIKAKQKPDWKARSEAFRNAMRQTQVLKNAAKTGAPLPPVQPSAPDPSLVPCPTCSRTFNEKAAERHIPRCAESTKRNADRTSNARRAASTKGKAPTRSRRTTRR